MNSKMIDLAKRAGFVFWQDDGYSAGVDTIDWSCDYSNEFDRYSKMLIEETIKELKQDKYFKSCD